MSWITILGIVIGGWVFLRLIGGERQREMVALARRIARELEDAKSKAREQQQAVPVPIAPSPMPAKNPQKR